MSTVIPFDAARAGTRKETAAAEPVQPQLVAMAHVDLKTVIDMVRCLRAMDDPAFLDEFNRCPREETPSRALA